MQRIELTNKGNNRITFFARTNHRNAGQPFGIRQTDRRFHFFTCGKTGTGKSSLLRTMLLQDMANDGGCTLFDPHGDLVQEVLATVPPWRIKDLVYLNLPDPLLAYRFNPFAGVREENIPLAAAGMVEVFKKLWPDDWGPRLEHVLRNVVYTLLETRGSSLADIPALLTDRTYRSQIVAGVKNPAVREFWYEEFDKYSPNFRAVVIAPLQNKLGALLTDPLLRRFLTEEGRTIDLREIMDSQKILLVNLDKGRIGEGPATLLGSLLLSHIALAGLSRSDQPEAERRDFFVFLDECQLFTTHALANMLSELRKFRVSVTLGTQYLSALEPEIRDAIFGNVGTLVSFRVGARDAEYLAKEFQPRFGVEDLIALPRFQIYLKLMIDGETSAPFSAETLKFGEDFP